MTIHSPIPDQAAVAAQPWLDRTLPADQRAALVLPHMTDDEKIDLLYGYYAHDWADRGYQRPANSRVQAAGYFKGVPRLGIPELQEADAGIGIASQRGPYPRERTALASGISSASTWNPESAREGGAMIGFEARASGFNILLAGGVNLVREPRNGRNFEYVGEDPWLAAAIIEAQIRGIQSNNIVCCIKHFAVNSQETGRNHMNARIGEVGARDSDLLAFQLAIEASSPGSVMAAYNRYNGDYAGENAWLLNEVLKQDWRYKGWVMSDWGACHSTVPAANNGLDQQSGAPFDRSPYFSDALKEAVENGHVSRQRFDDMVARVLWGLFDKGVVDYPVEEGGAIDYAAHARVSQAGAEEGMVLLKNARGLLPLAKTLGSIAIIGGHADVGVLSGGGSSQVYPIGGMARTGLGPANFPGPTVIFPSSPMAAIAARSGATVTYHDGVDHASAAALAAASELVIVFGNQWTGEALDFPLALDDNADALIAAVARANPDTVVVLQTGGPVLMPWLGDVGAVLEAWYPGSAGGEAIARVLFGEVDAAGRLPVTFPAALEQLPRPVLDGVGAPAGTRFDVDYHEGAAVGYKWFDLHAHEPLFPFGFGLSYGSAGFSALEVRDAAQLSVSFEVSNTSQREVSAVAQVYLAAPEGTWEAPQRLVGFIKVALAPGARRTATLLVDPRLLGVYQPSDKNWMIAPGQYEVRLGRSSRDVCTSVNIELPRGRVSMDGTRTSALA
ncbi:MAG: glycoside hydrolase family 3 C-terminal domain-containing protein [Pseudomonadota bacterium]